MRLIQIVFLYLTNVYGLRKQNSDINEEAFNTPEVKNKISDIEKELDSYSVQVQSLINQITDVMLSAGNKSLLRRSFKLKRKQISKNNKKWYDKDCKRLLREVKSAKMYLTEIFSTIHCAYNIIVNLRIIKDWLNIKRESTKKILQIC